MSKFEKKPAAAPGAPTEVSQSVSFIPEDYIERQADRRMGFITLGLFCIVLFAVIGAFFVTNRNWSDVHKQQQQINIEFAAEAKKIEQLKILEAQKKEMLDRAEIMTALREKVPRSILMAELINRMPEQLTLSELRLEGKRKQLTTGKSEEKSSRPKPRSLAKKKGKKSEPEAPVKPAPPRFDFTLELIGLAATDNEVADYHASLQDCPLLNAVDLLYSGEVTQDDVTMRKFRIEASLRRGADARNIEPLQVPRLRDALFISNDAEGATEPLTGVEDKE